MKSADHTADAATHGFGIFPCMDTTNRRLSRFYTSLPLLVVYLLLALALGAPASGESPTIVTGKTVYGQMGVEEVTVIALRDGVETARTKSAYHGTFRLSLEPGVYELHANGTLPDGGGTRTLSGYLKGVVVGGQRVDRLVIGLGEQDGAPVAPR